MSRNLYTVAVVERMLGERISAVLPDLRQAEEMVRRAVEENAPLVASYRVVLDGWGRAHEELGEGWRELRGAMDRDGYWISLGPIPRVEHHAVAHLINGYAVSALASALEDARLFAESTGCPIVVVWRTLYASFDDDEFDRG